MGSLPATRQMRVSIVLPLRNQAALTALLDRLYDPSSPDYRHFLSVEQFTEQFGPTVEDYQAVVEFARRNGLIVTDAPANRLLVPVQGTVSQIEKTFHVSMKVYRHPTEDRTFFSADREPSLDLRVPVAHITSLNDFSIPHPMLTEAAAGRAAAVLGSGPGGQYLASDIRAAYYGGTAFTGAGQAVGLLEFDGYDLNDVNLTFSNAGQSYNVPINNVLLDGATGAPLSGKDMEQVVDIVQAIGMAPGLSQVRVYIGYTANGFDDATIFNKMATENICKQLSVSWGWSPDDPATDDVFFQEFAAQGQSLFVASGDSGGYDYPWNSYFYPAEDVWVTAVGGTSLLTSAAGGSWVSETAWDTPSIYAGSGGGISPDAIPIPSWQRGVANASNAASTTLRNVPDVAAEADVDNFYCAMGVCAGGAGGTSFAAPRWAGFMALVNQQAAAAGAAPSGGLGFINPAIYAIGESSSYSSSMHDITSGNNDSFGQPIWYNAVAGYDLVTGWGSPNGQNLINALAPPPTGPGFTLAASPSSLTIASGTSGTSTITVVAENGFSGAVSLAALNLPGGVSASFDPNPATGSSVLTLTVSNSAVRGPYLVTVTGTSGAETATAAIALEVNAPGFSISPTSGALVLWQGGFGGTTLTVNDYDGFADSVTLGISALPSGVTASFNPNPTTGSSVLALTASDTATLEQIGNYALTITGTSGDLTASSRFYLGVQQALPIINLLTVPSLIAQGGSVTAGVTFSPQGNFTGTMSLSATGLPSGVTASFNPTTIGVGGISVLTVTASPSAPLGTFTLNIFGAFSPSGEYGSGAEDEYFLPLTVTATPTPTFTLSVGSDYRMVGQGGSVTDPITVNRLNGFTGGVDLYFPDGLPDGVAGSFSPNPATGGSVLTLTARNNAVPGNLALYMAGSSGGQTATAWVWLIITPPAAPIPAFSISTVGPTYNRGTKLYYGTVTIKNTGSATINAPIELVFNGLPSGVTLSNSAGAAPNGSPYLTIGSSLAAGASTSVSAIFADPSAVAFPISITAYSGAF